MIKRELGLIMVRELTFSSPLVTISAVDITPDLKQAHIFVSAMGTASDRKNALTVLESNRVLMQNELSRRVILKNTPHLYFKFDESIERGTRVLNILEELDLDEPQK